MAIITTIPYIQHPKPTISLYPTIRLQPANIAHFYSSKPEIVAFTVTNKLANGHGEFISAYSSKGSLLWSVKLPRNAPFVSATSEPGSEFTVIDVSSWRFGRSINRRNELIVVDLANHLCLSASLPLGVTAAWQISPDSIFLWHSYIDRFSKRKSIYQKVIAYRINLANQVLERKSSKICYWTGFPDYFRRDGNKFSFLFYNWHIVKDQYVGPMIKQIFQDGVPVHDVVFHPQPFPQDTAFWSRYDFSYTGRYFAWINGNYIKVFDTQSDKTRSFHAEGADRIVFATSSNSLWLAHSGLDLLHDNSFTLHHRGYFMSILGRIRLGKRSRHSVVSLVNTHLRINVTRRGFRNESNFIPLGANTLVGYVSKLKGGLPTLAIMRVDWQTGKIRQISKIESPPLKGILPTKTWRDIVNGNADLNEVW